MAIDHPELEECVEDFDSVFYDVEGFEERTLSVFMKMKMKRVLWRLLF